MTDPPERQPMSTTSPTPSTPSYVVLSKVGDNWQIENDNVAAANAEAAIRLACNLADVKPGDTYVAVPARSWKPVFVFAEVTTALTFKNAGPKGSP